MAEDRGDLILEFLRRFDRRLQDVQDDLRNTRARMSSVGEQFGGLDILDARVDRIERRLDPVEG